MPDQNFRVEPGLEVGIGGTVLFVSSNGYIGFGSTLPTSSVNVVGNVSISGVTTTKNLTVSGVSTLGIITAGNIFSTGFITATSFVGSFIGNGTIPIGGIIMWSGSIFTIPSGWELCDGSNGTPDLRSRFVVGAGTDVSTTWSFNSTTGAQTFTFGQSSPSVGSTGGRVGVALTVGDLPAHTHSYTDSTNAGTGGGTGGGGADTGTTTLNKTTGSSGSNLYHENRPPYYALAFIMRTS